MAISDHLEFGLDNQTIEKIVALFRDIPEINQAIVYGSRSKGCYKKGSDIDIVLPGDELTLKILLRASQLLDDLLLPYTFDLSLYDQIENPDLLDPIRRLGKALYSR